ncbi:Aste57867_16445 [Aphanomyces stellatus]|uniref:Aste57867_16445 protein n=1 Tax=Aphanomyces stellatus TaxID=120398 RepID=A0A485L6Q1_9STRA|nr:hypothetical protein As57867_016388 [Aphanomyces stellatus]VFT93219.1 Aste57867_16445 [Aphanomyces stellatus]
MAKRSTTVTTIDVHDLDSLDLGHDMLDTPVLQSSDDIHDDPLDDAGASDCCCGKMILVALPRFAIMMGWAAQWAVLGPLLEILVSSSAVQLIQIVGPLAGLVVVPTLGVLSDGCTSRFGRRRPFIFGGTVASIVAYVLLMFASDVGCALGDTPSSRTWTTAIVVVCYVWTDISLNIAMVPTTLLMADLVGRRQVTGSVFTGLLAAGGLAFTAVYIAAFGPAHQTLKTFLSILIVLLAATASTTCYYVKETPRRACDSASSSPVRDALTAVVDGIRRLPSPLGIYFWIILLTTYGFTSYNGAKGQFFGLVVNGGDARDADLCGKSGWSACTLAQTAFNDGVRVAGLTDTLQVLAFVYVLFLPSLVHRFGAKRVIAASIVPQMLYTFLAFSKNVPLNVAIAVSCSVTQATISLLIVPLIVNVIGPDNSLGLFNGALNSALCVGQLLNYAMSAALVTSSMGYALPILVGGCVSVVAGGIAAFAFPLDMTSV